MHTRLAASYSDDCCARLATDDPENYDDVQKAFALAADQVFNNKGFNADDLNSKPVKSLIQQTYTRLKRQVNMQIKQEMPIAMQQALQTNVFVFSGFKTYASLKEASSLLVNEDGSIKPEYLFKQDISKLNSTYNQLYLEAERIFAISSSQAAAQWQSYAKDGDRYDLQYRTAADSKVRDTHKVLHNITLPIDNDFWNHYFVPNGWRCRCKIVQVLKGKYEVTDSEKAMKAGQDATTALTKDGVNKLAMFRFNPGKQQVIFPQHHPYFALSKVAPAAKKIIEQQAKEEIKPTKFEVRKEVKTIDDLNEVFTEYASFYPEYFERGFKKIAPESKSGNNGSTDGRGNIWLAKSRINHVCDALTNIKKGAKTTLDQEDAISTLWHEITHNRSKPGTMALTKTERLHMELANEYVSRNTLAGFMETLGGKLQNEVLITDRKTTGYNTMVKNYQHLVAWCDANQDGVLKTVQKHLFEEKYNVQITGLVKGISDNTPYKLAAVKALVVKARDYPENYFLKYLEDNKNLLIKKKL